MEIWRVNLRSGSLQRGPVPEAWARLGGRGLLARILLDEVPPACEPLGPGNRLVFSPGLLVGHMLSSCDRISIGGKSPLTRGIKEANAGGTTGLQMACMGIRALILEDQTPWARERQTDWRVLHLSLAGARFDPAGDLAGLGVFAAAERLRKRYGDQVAISLIGPGGEMRLASAGIQNLDKDRVPSRIAARGGLGAVMAPRASRWWCSTRRAQLNRPSPIRPPSMLPGRHTPATFWSIPRAPSTATSAPRPWP
jgi:aldehyde:ferredoxin oxidoreductase